MMEDYTWYVYDPMGYFLYEVTQPGNVPIPTPSTDIPPPKTHGTEVAVWRDWLNNWEVLPSKPVPPPPSAQPWEIDQEKERRVSMGFVYGGKAFETNSQSQMNDILGKMGDAIAYITVDQGDLTSLRWSDSRYDFAWTAADGTQVPMTAPECLAFTRAAVRRKEALVGAALALKAMSPIPVDYYLDSYWPDMDAIHSVAARK